MFSALFNHLFVFPMVPFVVQFLSGHRQNSLVHLDDQFICGKEWLRQRNNAVQFLILFRNDNDAIGLLGNYHDGKESLCSGVNEGAMDSMFKKYIDPVS
jgi:hypothetical protein